MWFFYNQKARQDESAKPNPLSSRLCFSWFIGVGLKGVAVLALSCVLSLSCCAQRDPDVQKQRTGGNHGFLLTKSEPDVPVSASEWATLPANLKPVASELMKLHPVIKPSSKGNPHDAEIVSPVKLPLSLILKSAETDIASCKAYSNGSIQQRCSKIERKTVRDFVSMLRDRRVNAYLKGAVIDDLKGVNYIDMFNAARLPYEVARRCRKQRNAGYVRLYW